MIFAPKLYNKRLAINLFRKSDRLNIITASINIANKSASNEFEIAVAQRIKSINERVSKVGLQQLRVTSLHMIMSY